MLNVEACTKRLPHYPKREIRLSQYLKNRGGECDKSSSNWKKVGRRGIFAEPRREDEEEEVKKKFLFCSKETTIQSREIR